MRSKIFYSILVAAALGGFALLTSLMPEVSVAKGSISYATGRPLVEHSPDNNSLALPQVAVSEATMVAAPVATVGSVNAGTMTMHTSSSCTAHNYGGGQPLQNQPSYSGGNVQQTQAIAYATPLPRLNVHHPTVHAVGATLADASISTSGAQAAPRRSGRPTTGGGDAQTENPDIHVPEPLGDAVLPMLALAMVYVVWCVFGAHRRRHMALLEKNTSDFDCQLK